LDIHAHNENLVNSASDIGKTRVPGVVGSFKTETTADVTSGIELAVRRVLEMCGIGVGGGSGDFGSGRILSLTIGTTVRSFVVVSFMGKIVMRHRSPWP
jgi:hypothetical protein